jgi:RNA polymerase sigma factor (sigma-70 family)
VDAAALCIDCGLRPARSRAPVAAAGRCCGTCASYRSRHGGAPRPAVVRLGRPPETERCTVPGCSRRHHGKGFCAPHYQRQYHGTMLDGPPPPIDPAPGKAEQQCRSKRRHSARASVAVWSQQVTRMAYTLAATSTPDALLRAGLSADDLTQIGLLAYWRARGRPGVGTIPRHARARATLAARGAMLDAFRGGRKRAGDPPRDALGAADWSQDDRDCAIPAPTAPGVGWAGRNPLARLPRRVRRAVGRLPAEQQRVLRLTLQDRTQQEIAAIVGSTENAVAIRKHRALATLRSQFAAA